MYKLNELNPYCIMPFNIGTVVVTLHTEDKLYKTVV